MIQVSHEVPTLRYSKRIPTNNKELRGSGALPGFASGSTEDSTRSVERAGTSDLLDMQLRNRRAETNLRRPLGSKLDGWFGDCELHRR
jgi:hypothetical protein